MDYKESNRFEHSITDEVKPDPTVLPEVPGWHILCRPVEIANKTKGGIILTANTQKTYEYVSNIARVVKIGDLAYKHEKFLNGPYCKVGDYVMFGRNNVDHRFSYQGVSFVLLKDDSIKMVVDKPSDVSEFEGLFQDSEYN